MLSNILEWAGKMENIRSMLLVGSLAGQGKKDHLSDLDISIFGSHFDFISDDAWLDAIAPNIVCIHEQFQWDDLIIPTRLTIFDNGVKVDFSFHPISLMEKMLSQKKLSETYDAGYKIIMDKDGIAANLPAASYQAYVISKPDISSFAICQKEFWFEAYHVAKYIVRGDVWTAQMRDHDMKKWLLTMLEWNASAMQGFQLRIKREGKYMRDWINQSYYSRLPDCFASWGSLPQQEALLASLSLFRNCAKETAEILSYHYNEKADQGISYFISTIILQADGEPAIQSI